MKNISFALLVFALLSGCATSPTGRSQLMLVRHQIYVLRPDLMPAYLKGEED